MHDDYCDCYQCVKEREARTMEDILSDARQSLGIRTVPTSAARTIIARRCSYPKAPVFQMVDGVKVYPYKRPGKRTPSNSLCRARVERNVSGPIEVRACTRPDKVVR